MALSNWLCSNNAKNMLVKIVHPGGRIDFHDRPMLAAEIMLQNPRCCVTYPNVFQQPSAVLPPDSVLLLGQKYYVVPIGTLRKLGRIPAKSLPSLRNEVNHQRHQTPNEEDGLESLCWIFTTNKNANKVPYSCLSSSSEETTAQPKEEDRCFMCLFSGAKIKGGDKDGGSTMESSAAATSSSSESRELNRNNNIGQNGRSHGIKGSSSRSSFDYWQPSLDSINEEYVYDDNCKINTK